MPSSAGLHYCACYEATRVLHEPRGVGTQALWVQIPTLGPVSCHTRHQQQHGVRAQPQPRLRHLPQDIRGRVQHRPRGGCSFFLFLR